MVVSKKFLEAFFAYLFRFFRRFQSLCGNGKPKVSFSSEVSLGDLCGFVDKYR